jgi:hypothetical protein
MSVAYNGRRGLWSYQAGCCHVSGINGLASLLDRCGKLAALIEAEAVPYRAKLHMILGVFYHEGNVG